MTITIGDLVELRGQKPRVLGLVIYIGEEQRRMYGDGIETTSYAKVLWFHKKYGGTPRRFSPPNGSLDIVSKA